MDVESIFDDSLKRVCSRDVDGQDFFEAFYARFTGSSAEVAEHFSATDMSRQHTMLKKALYHLLTFYASSDADFYLASVAVSHSRAHLDICPELYDLWLETLIDAVRSFDPLFDADIELAWRLVMAPGIVFMKFHYDRPQLLTDRPVITAEPCGPPAGPDSDPSNATQGQGTKP